MEEVVDEVGEIGEDFAIVATEKEMEMLEGRIPAKRMVVETHLGIFHCRNYLENPLIILRSPHCKNLCPLILILMNQLACRLKTG